MPTTLIVYYSRSGASEQLAKAIQKELRCDMDKLEYAGTQKKVGVLAAAFETLGKARVKFKGDTHRPEEYRQIIFVSPMWAGSLSSPIRSYMAKHKGSVKSYLLAVASAKGIVESASKDAVRILDIEPAYSQAYIHAKIKNGEIDIKKFTQQ